MEQRTVYAVEVGAYSDYYVAGVYTELRLAEQARAATGRGDAVITEWPLNPGAEEMSRGLRVWSVWMKRDGDGWAELAGVVSADESPTFHQTAVSMRVWAEDEQAAVEIVNEKRLQLIASGQWPEDKEE